MRPHLVLSALACIGIYFCGSCPADQLIVGAWNIEHCGQPGDMTDPLQIAEYIESSHVDLLGLEEIYDTDGNEATRTNSKLDAAFQKLNMNSANAWEYEL